MDKKFYNIKIIGSMLIEGHRKPIFAEMACRCEPELFKAKFDKFIAGWVFEVLDKTKLDIEKSQPWFCPIVTEFDGLDLENIKEVFGRAEKEGMVDFSKQHLEIMLKARMPHMG